MQTIKAVTSLTAFLTNAGSRKLTRYFARYFRLPRTLCDKGIQVMENLISNIGAIISLALGVMAIIWPKKTESFVSVQSIGKEGLSEIRSTYGGFFAGLAIYAMVVQTPEVFIALGIGWLGAALVRTATLIFGSLTKKNVAAVFFEAIIGTLCISVVFT
ncbi:MAG: hypothetical protein COA86_18940 [Kangiella sp.]|nr:MAG: hypothetical protein COA86_18940 [Kangiella sp.]